MPEQRAHEPAAERNAAREYEREQRRGIVDFPAGPDHDEDGERVDPMSDPHPDRVDNLARRHGGADGAVLDCFDRHGRTGKSSWANGFESYSRVARPAGSIGMS